MFCIVFIYIRANGNILTTVRSVCIANESSRICLFLALRPEFHSNLRVILSTPKHCQSATFGRLTFCVYTLLFLRNSRLMSPRPPHARHAHRANRSTTRETYMLNYKNKGSESRSCVVTRCIIIEISGLTSGAGTIFQQGGQYQPFPAGGLGQSPGGKRILTTIF